MDAAVERAGDLADARADHRATTLEGLQAKARTMRWYYGDDLDFGEHPAELVVRSIVEDLLALAAPATA